MPGLKGMTAAIATAACLFGAATAAASTPVGSSSGHVSMPPPDNRGLTVSQQDNYRIGPLDVLDINVWQVDSLTRTVNVDASGDMDFPLIGTVMAAGKTPHELGQEIAARLDKTYLEQAQVSVFVKQQLSQRFTVEGSVKTPGIYPVVGRMTLLQAIATAQGVADDAKTRNVVIFRNVEDKRMAGIVDLGGVQAGKIDDPPIYAGDVIVVPASGARRAWKDILASTPILFFLHP